MSADDPRWRRLPVLCALHGPWWRNRGRRLGESARPFTRDWEELLAEAGLIAAEERSDALRDARLLESHGLVALRPPRHQPQWVERISIPVAAEHRLARLFGDPVDTPPTGPGLADIDWEPELAFLREARTAPALADLLALNRFLAGGGRHRPRVPVKERSLGIFGDEKRLDALLATALFQPGALGLDQLRCEPVSEPLGWRRGARPDGPVIVLENLATWESYRRWDAVHPQFSAVVYGKGLVFVDAVRGLADLFGELGGARPVVYFGDLDPTGIGIPWRASVRAAALDLPEIRPHSWSYARLLEVGRAVPWDGDPVRPGAMAWLGDLAGPVTELFARGERIAQEHVGWELLSSLPAP